jgi:5'-nucleotidase / UDP-sugar diphosphatase
MKRFLRTTAIILMTALILSGCASGPQARIPGKAYTITVLHTNDHHGTILPSGGQGGLAERATFIKGVRAAGGSVLVLDAGDINTGSALSNMFKAEIDIKAYDMIGYDAVAMGNHEFDNPLSVLETQMKLAKFPFLSANITRADGKYLDKAYIVKEYEGARVGVFGLTTLRTLKIASPDKSLSFKSEIDTAKEMVKLLRETEKCDIVILVGHLGIVEEEKGQITSEALANAVSGIDLIIDGHSHTAMTEARLVNKTPIVSANEWGKFVGKATFTVVDGKVQTLGWEPVQINKKDTITYAADAEVAAMIAPYKAKADLTLKEVVAETADLFEFGDRLSRKKEIALGDMVNDGAVWYAKSVLGKNVDFAFTNGGNIRAELPKGKITREQITTVLPFDNWIYITTMTGAQVNSLFEFIASLPQGAGAWAQVSAEVRYTIDYSKDAAKGTLKDLTIHGQPVDPNATYSFITNDYLMGGGDGYTVLKKNVAAYNTSTTLRDVIIAYAQNQKILVPKTDGRIKIIGGMTF